MSDLIWIKFSSIGVKINKEILQVRQSKFLPWPIWAFLHCIFVTCHLECPTLVFSFILEIMKPHTMLLMPSGYKNRLYKESTVSLGSISTLFWRRIGPVSRPSSAQNTLKPPCSSPSIKVLTKTDTCDQT